MHRAPGRHRRLRHAGPGVQGHEDGRPHGPPAGDHAEPRGRPGRRRARAAPGQGRGARPPRRPGADPRRGEGRDGSDGRRSTSAPWPATAAGTVELDDAIFGIEPNVPVMHQVVTAQLAARPRRHPEHQDPGRGARRRRKPWRQKGTGRARQGSTRCAPLGGRRRGPRPQAPQLQAEAPPRRWCSWPCARRCPTGPPRARSAVVEALGLRRAQDQATAGGALAALGPRRARCWSSLGRDEEAAIKSFRNLPEVQLLLVDELNAYDVLCNDWIVFTRATLPVGRPDHADDRRRPTAERRHCRGGRVMSDPRDIIIRPVVSEKSYGLLDAGVYTFVVAPRRQQDRDPRGGRGDLQRAGRPR